VSQVYNAEVVPPAGRQRYWTEAVRNVLFPLQTILKDPPHFVGVIKSWPMGALSLSYYRSGPVTYRREREHVAQDDGEPILVSFAGRSDVMFSQNRSTVVCKRGQFVLERGNAPSDYVQSDLNTLLVLKMPADLLKQRIRSIDRYSSLVFDSHRAAGGLLLDTLKSLPRRVGESDERTSDRLGDWVLELVALSLEDNQQILGSHLSSVQAAHMVRIERFIRQNLRDRALSAELVASACGISVRYVHQLFSRSGGSVGDWIRELRLQSCDRELRDSGCIDSIGELAYRWGFGDQAQFSRHYKRHFGQAPKETRRLTREGMATHAPAADSSVG